MIDSSIWLLLPSVNSHSVSVSVKVRFSFNEFLSSFNNIIAAYASATSSPEPNEKKSSFWSSDSAVIKSKARRYVLIARNKFAFADVSRVGPSVWSERKLVYLSSRSRCNRRTPALAKIRVSRRLMFISYAANI